MKKAAKKRREQKKKTKAIDEIKHWIDINKNMKSCSTRVFVVVAFL